MLAPSGGSSAGEFAALALAFVVGAALAALYLRLLWSAVCRVAGGRQHPLRFAAAALARVGLTLLGLYAVIRLGDWRHALAAVTGFAAVRALLAWRMAPKRWPPGLPGRSR
jgi:F1F0 ATPase subunit 2